ncbi:hypothetical protein MWU65_01890 [Cellulophaga sp. F20128]|uniref:hypothetical protein n=1 Tax=Cellulophaga sp. F20128 TaxID=2926413 RepID=UPI001FF36633|nr:hypothetical protein [Cellulophaga sp. F20128]MCK0155911.1 hypothetical protein [Cellulophaga sp. F20128]
MKRVLSILLLFAAGLSFTACSLNDDGTNFKYVNLKVVSAEVPQSFELGQRYDIKVTYLSPNSCTYFEGFDIHKHEITEREIYPIGAELVDRDNCEESAAEVEVTLKFEVIYEDDYLFKFWTGQNADGEDEYLEVAVPVN